MSEFLNMGGYAPFVWPSFAVTAIVLGANVWFARRNYHAALARVNRRRAARDAEFSA